MAASKWNLSNRRSLDLALGDLTQFRNDLATSAIALVNAVQPSPTNASPAVSIQSVWSQAWTTLTTDWQRAWQAATDYEMQALQTALQEIDTFLNGSSNPSPVQSPPAQSPVLPPALPPASPVTPATPLPPPPTVSQPPLTPPPLLPPVTPFDDPRGGSITGSISANLNGTWSGSYGGNVHGTFSGPVTGTLNTPAGNAYVSGILSGAMDGSMTSRGAITAGYMTSGTLSLSGSLTGSLTISIQASSTNSNNNNTNPTSGTLSGSLRGDVSGGIDSSGNASGSIQNGFSSVVFDLPNTASGGGANGSLSGKSSGLPPPSAVTPSCNCGCPGAGGDLDQSSSASAVPTVPEGTDAPVRYADGVASIATTDLHSNGFGFPWGQTRTWSNGTGYDTGSDNGSGWVDTYIPHLIQADGSSSGTLIFIANGNTAYYYDLVNGSYQPRLDDGSKLTYNSTSDTYTLIDPQGDQILFDGFGSSRLSAQQGQFASYTDPYGEQMAVTSYTSDGHIAEMQRSVTGNGNTTIESWLYRYLPSTDPNAGLLSGVTERTQTDGGAWNIVQQVQYSYYDGTQTYGGNLGDLMTATVEDGGSNVLSTDYYRYYTPGQANGYSDGLEYVFSPASYTRLTAALGTNVSSLTDAQVAPYADNYFQYDSLDRVTLETVQGQGDSQTGGGLGTYTFSYTTSSNATGPNSWTTKTVVTNPDGSTDTVYTNFIDEVMLDDHYDPSSSLHSDHFYGYNNMGQLVLDASPSAVSGYNGNWADLMGYANGGYQYLNNNSGLITRYDIYGTTTAGETTAGGVANYLEDVEIQQGQQGTLIPQETWQYYAHSYQNQTVAELATDTVYRNNDGTGAETTSYSYTWYSGTAQLLSAAESAPVISAAENGPGTADVTTTYFDTYGNAQWIKDPDGYIQYDAYDPVTGALLTQITDVNTADAGEFTGLPSGWTTPTGGGLNLVTQYQVDALGRTTKETSPDGNVTYYVYRDPQHEERVYQGWNSSTGTATQPTEVIRQDAADGYDETLTMTATPHLTNGAPDGTEAISGLQTLTRDYTNDAGQVIAEDAYFNLGGLAYSTGVMGTVNVNYYQTQYGYDSWGRLVRTQTPNGTIYRTAYNSLGEEVSAWVGTNDTPTSGEWSPTNNTGTSNMVEVSSYQYDNGGVGDGNLTQETEYPGLGAPAQVTDSWYDWRDRLVAQKSGVESSEDDGVGRPIIVTTYDNLHEAIKTQQYDGDGVTPQIVNGVLQPLSASLLRAQGIDSYDDQGRVYQTQVFDVNPSTGAVSSSALTTNYYYDHRGDLLAESDPGGLWTKSVYDGAGRDVTAYTTDGAGGTTWTEASSVANDTVLEQNQAVYDGDSNVIETIDGQRFDNATGTGPLGTPTSGIGARLYYAANYYDNADRLIASVDAGTDGGTAWTRPSSVPSSSPTLLVTNYAYNAMGLVQDVTDPMGIDTRTLYDNLGRTTKTIQDYTGGTPGNENDVATEYGYDGDNNVTYVQADEPGGTYQKTAYVYGVTTASGSGVNSNDILSAIQNPDPTTGNPSSSQQDSYLVNALGQRVRYKDRDGNVHQYTYDVLGRLASDDVTTLGAGVDGTVRQIIYAYDSQGNPYLITSLNGSGGIANQVEDVYNGLDQLTGEYQSHSGAVNTSSTPEVQYAYTEMSGGQNDSRLVSMTYPYGYLLNYNYNAGLDSNIRRLSSISDVENGGNVTLESYKYLGLDTVVERDHPQTGVNQTYISQNGQTGDAGDQYVGLDRFGRVVNDNWVNTKTGQSTDDFAYGYDEDGDVLYRQNLVDSAMSELYQYDNLHQLVNFQRGTLNGGDNGIVGSPSASQSWSPDALGNFSSVTTNGTTQTRTANQQNEITGISGSGTIGYDANGNLTADGSGNTYVYDAWNRLVAVSNNGTTVAGYSYDGLGRRITQTEGGTTTDLYYSSADQVIEEDVGGVTQARNVWSPVYVNALVLRDQSSQRNGILDQRLYAQQDANWDVTALVDTSGNVVERYDYTPYGVVTVLNPDFSARGSSSYAMPYLWQGERYDWVVNFYHSFTRDVSPSLMRPLQMDYLGLLPDNNPYRWEGNEPTDELDPSGLDAKIGPGLFPLPSPSTVVGHVIYDNIYGYSILPTSSVIIGVIGNGTTFYAPILYNPPPVPIVPLSKPKPKPNGTFIQLVLYRPDLPSTPPVDLNKPYTPLTIGVTNYAVTQVGPPIAFDGYAGSAPNAPSLFPLDIYKGLQQGYGPSIWPQVQPEKPPIIIRLPEEQPADIKSAGAPTPGAETIKMVPPPSVFLRPGSHFGIYYGPAPIDASKKEGSGHAGLGGVVYPCFKNPKR